MFEMKCRSYTDAEQAALAALFGRALAKDPAFAAAFPTPEGQTAHAAEFVRWYAAHAEVHTFYEDGAFRAAALWSLPGQAVPSPVWDFPLAEPCCKLYLLASEQRGCGDALLRFAFLRYEGTPLALLCAADWQRDYFARYGFAETGSTAFGHILRRDGDAPLPRCAH